MLVSRQVAVLALVFSTIALFGCPKKDTSVHIRIDGSSTVHPIAEAVVEAFEKTEKDVKPTIRASGSGSGFARFCRGETSFSNASRPIEAEEIAQCKKNGVEFIELPIAYDGIVIAANVNSHWLTKMSTDDLKRLFEPAAQGKIERWNQMNPAWPDKEIHLFSPGVASGTFDYFTAAIVGREKASRGDLTQSEDDNVLVQGIATDEYALGYFGYAYYEMNKKRLKALPVNGVMPSRETILNGSYSPLSRPLFLYVSIKDLKKPAVERLANFFLEKSEEIVPKVGYFPIEPEAMKLAKDRLKARKTGTIFVDEASKRMSLQMALQNAK